MTPMNGGCGRDGASDSSQVDLLFAVAMPARTVNRKVTEMKLSRVLLHTAGAAALATTMACSGSGSGVLPTASTPSGATILGTVDAASAAPQGIHVSAMGTSVSALTDAAGRFTLSEVPAGKARLRFEAPGIDAQLEISGLRDGQVLSVSVRVSGTQAALMSGPAPIPEATPSPDPTPSPRPSPSDEDEVEFRGRIQTIGNNSLTVDGRLVAVDGSTVVRRRGESIPFSSLKVGDLVEVEGAPRSDGSILARKITLEDDNDDDDDDDRNDDDNDDDDDDGGGGNSGKG